MKATKFLVVMLCFVQGTIYPFKPIGHVLLKDRIVASLPADNIFRIAMLKYPHIAAWGAVGPDLGYNPDQSRMFKSQFKRQIKNSWLLADIAHYHSVGTFTTKLIEEAERQNDEKFYAFVGGWITHIAGDFACHSTLVKPDAGHYISCESKRQLHKDIEQLADFLLYKRYLANYNLTENLDSKDYWPVFFGISASPSGANEKDENLLLLNKMLGGSVNKYFLKVYRETYDLPNAEVDLVRLASTYSRSVGVGLGKLGGFGFKPETLIAVYSQSRVDRVFKAFEEGVTYGNSYLTKAVTQDKVFSDAWNLDIGEDGEPTYIIRLDAAEIPGARTKNDVYATFIQNDGKRGPNFKLTTNIGGLDFIFYQADSYYYAVNLGGEKGELQGWKPDNIRSVELSLRPSARQSNDPFFIKRAIIYYNGKPIASQKENSDGSPLELTNSKPLNFLLQM